VNQTAAMANLIAPSPLQHLKTDQLLYVVFAYLCFWAEIKISIYLSSQWAAAQSAKIAHGAEGIAVYIIHYLLR
jgi:hypothetical protein